MTNSEPMVLDALVLGGGFGGIHMLHQLREMGLTVVALEAGAGGGGGSALMQPTVANLSLDDMIALAAYVASLQP